MLLSSRAVSMPTMLQENDAHLNKWHHYVWENKEKLQRGQFDTVGENNPWSLE